MDGFLLPFPAIKIKKTALENVRYIVYNILVEKRGTVMKSLPADIAQLQAVCGTRVILDGESRIVNITDKDTFDRCLIYSEAKSQKIKDSIRWSLIDAVRKADRKESSTLEGMKKMYPSMDSHFFDLHQKLLAFAGEAICFPPYEEDLDNILNYGQFWVGSNAKLMRGEPSRCHANSANLWEQNKEATRICTGYALSEDGMWRQHSWLVWHKSRSNQIVETTAKRIAYYGFVMPYDMCQQFADENF